MLRIFSYQPNPRVWKATIAARLAGVEIEVRGAAPADLADWLWDFDARPLSEADRADDSTRQLGRTGFSGTALRKTRAFLDAHPFGTVPAAFSPDGTIGIFESNSIARAVARLAPDPTVLYGAEPYQASRIDSFLDASLVFGCATQPYLLALRGDAVGPACHAAAGAATETWLGGIDRALSPARDFLVGTRLTLADICFACELTMLWYERPHRLRLAKQGLEPVLPDDLGAVYPRAADLFTRLRRHPDFSPDLGAHLERLERQPLPTP